MTKRLSIEDARDNLSEVLDRVSDGQEPVIIERGGQAAAVLISPEQWERYQQATKERFFEVVDRIHEQHRGADPDEIEREVTAVADEVRRARYGRRAGKGSVIAATSGLFASEGSPLSIEELRRVFEEGVAEEVRERMGG